MLIDFMTPVNDTTSFLPPGTDTAVDPQIFACGFHTDQAPRSEVSAKKHDGKYFPFEPSERG